MGATTRAEPVQQDEFRELVELYLTAIEAEAIDATPMMETALEQIADQLNIREFYDVLRHPPAFEIGNETEIITPTRTLTGHYAAIELDALIPSHHPISFAPDARYPHGCQQRDYSGDEAEKQKIIKGAQQFNNAFLLAVTPSAVDGAPIVTRHGFVLGGNGRTMMLKRTSKEMREHYNWQLWRKVEDFGLPIDKLRTMRFPVLVRLVDVNLHNCALYSNILNTSLTQKTNLTTQAVSLSRQLNRQTQELLAELFEESGADTLAQFFANPNATRRLIRLLRQAEIITDQNQNELVDQNTQVLSSLGKLTVEGILLSSVLEDKQVIEAAREYTVHIMKSIPLFVRMKALPDGWNLIPLIREAMLLEHERRASGMRKNDFTAQSTFERPDIDPHTARVWDLLDFGPRKFSAAMREYVELAEEETQGDGFGFNEPRTPRDVLALIHQKYLQQNYSSQVLGDSRDNEDDRRAFLELMELYALAFHNDILDKHILSLFDKRLAEIAAMLGITAVQYKRLIEVISFNHHAEPSQKVDLWSVLHVMENEQTREEQKTEETRQTQEKHTTGQDDDRRATIQAEALRRFQHYQHTTEENADEIYRREKYLKDMKKNVRKSDFPGFFPTEPPVIRRMLQEAGITSGSRILEPSAGSGAIADTLMNAYGKDCIIDVCENNPDLRELLTYKGYTLVGANFLEYKETDYDYILMNPPFEQRNDVLHVKHAYKLLRPGGRIVAIMSNGVFGSSQPVFRRFVEWVDDHGFHEELPEGSFSESDTQVFTRLVVIDKPVVEEPTVSYRFDSFAVATGEYVEDEITGQQYQVVSVSGEKIVLQELETAVQIHYIAELPSGKYRKITFDELRRDTYDTQSGRQQTTEGGNGPRSGHVHRDRGITGQPDAGRDGGSDSVSTHERGKFKSDVVIVRQHYTWRPTETEIEEFLDEHVEVNLRKLFWYQVEGVMAARRGLGLHGGFLNADSTGTGKTAQQLALAYLESKATGKPALIVTKSKDIIADSFAKARSFLNIPFHLYNGTLRPGVNICTYNDLVAPRFQKHMEFTVPVEKVVREQHRLPRVVTEEKPTSGVRFRVHGQELSVVLFDESHMLINKTTGWTQQGLYLVHEAPKVAFFSATPLDKVEHLHYLRRTGIYKTNEQFERLMRALGFELRYRTTKIAENEYIEKPYYAKMSDYPIAITAIALENLFEDLTEDGGMIKRELSLGEVDINIIRGTLPVQAHAVMELIDEYWTEVAMSKNIGYSTYAGVIMQRQKTELEAYKIRHALDIVHRDLREGRSVIIFCEQVNDQDEPSPELGRARRSTINLMREILEQRYGKGSTVTITGGQSDEEIARGLQLFQSNVKRILFASTGKGSTGLNMDDTSGLAPRSQIIMTPPISARTNVQLIGRVARATTKTRPRVYYIFSDAAVDARLREILEIKMRLLTAAVSGSIENLDLEEGADNAEEDLTQEEVWNWFDGVRTTLEGKKRYRELSLKLHPDTNPDKNDSEGTQFKEMQNEYEKWTAWMKEHRSANQFAEHSLLKKEKIYGRKFDKPFNAEIYTKVDRNYDGSFSAWKKRFIVLSGTMAGEISPDIISTLKAKGFKKIYRGRVDRWEAEYSEDTWRWIINLFEQPTQFYESETEPSFTENDLVIAVDKHSEGGFTDSGGFFIREGQRGTVVRVRERATSPTTQVYLYDVRWQNNHVSRRLPVSNLNMAPVDPAEMSEEEFVDYYINQFTYEDLTRPQIVLDLLRAQQGHMRPNWYYVNTQQELVDLIRSRAEEEARREYAALQKARDKNGGDDTPPGGNNDGSRTDGLADYRSRHAAPIPRRPQPVRRAPQTVDVTRQTIDEEPTVISLEEARKLPFKPIPLPAYWKELLGAVAPTFSLLIWGLPGSGKSSLVLMLCHALLRFGDVLYITGEEHISRISERAKRLRINSGRLYIMTTRTIQSIQQQMRKAQYRFVVVDSVNVMTALPEEFVTLRKEFPAESFLFIAHAATDGSTYRGRGIVDIAHDVDIVIEAKEGTAQVTKNRFGELTTFPIFDE